MNEYPERININSGEYLGDGYAEVPEIEIIDDNTNQDADVM